MNRIFIISMLLAGFALFATSVMSSEVGPGAKISMGAAETSSLPKNVKIDYWENGKPRVLTGYNDLGDVIGTAYFRDDGTLEQEKTFDDRGRTLAMAYFNTRGGLKEGADGWAAMIFKYDNGIMRGQGYYDSDGKLKIYKIYNAAGDLVCKKYIGDEEPDPTELYSNARSTSLAPQSFEFYDSMGRRTGTVTAYKDDYLDWFPYSYPYWYYERYAVVVAHGD